MDGAAFVQQAGFLYMFFNWFILFLLVWVCMTGSIREERIVWIHSVGGTVHWGPGNGCWPCGQEAQWGMHMFFSLPLSKQYQFFESFMQRFWSCSFYCSVPPWLPYHPNFVSSLSSLTTHQLQYVLLIPPGVDAAVHWSSINFLGATPLKKADCPQATRHQSAVPQLGVEAHEPLPTECYSVEFLALGQWVPERREPPARFRTSQSWGVGSGCGVPTGLELSIDTDSLCFGQLHISFAYVNKYGASILKGTTVESIHINKEVCASLA